MKWIAAAATMLAMAGCSSPPPKLDAHDAWARESVADSAAVYLTIDNRGGSADRLLSVRSTPGTASLHSTETTAGVARMRPVPPGDGLELPAGGSLRLKPHGPHVMLTGLAQPLRRGDQIALTLEFRRSPPAQITVRVLEAGATGHADH